MATIKPRHNAIHRMLFEEHESDRGCVIFCASIVEEHLESLLRAALRKDKDAAKVIESLFNVYAPFSTFSAKIQVNYALGLIPYRLYKQLMMVKKLRNDFAHDNEAVSFESPKYKSQIEAFRESFRGGVDDIEVHHLPKFKYLGKRLLNRFAFCMCISEIAERLEFAEEVATMRLYDHARLMEKVDSTTPKSSGEGKPE
jgi:hypothetical protein